MDLSTLTSRFTPPTNYIGTFVFISYIVAALVLTFRITSLLLRLSQKSNASPSQSSLAGRMSALAVASFAVLSFNMLSVLFVSYINWSRTAYPHQAYLSPSALHTIPARSVLWMLSSKLFTDFAQDLLGSKEAWIWAQVALLWTMGVSLWMAVEGRKRGVPRLGEFFALAQILPVSFTFNLCLVAMALIEKDPEARPSVRGGQRRANAKGENSITPGPMFNSHLKNAIVVDAPTSPYVNSRAILLSSIGLYVGLLSFLPEISRRGTEGSFVGSIFFLRACLLMPFFIASPNYPAPRTIRKCYILLIISAILLTAWRTVEAVQHCRLSELAHAVHANPPVSALGDDLILGIVSAAEWWRWKSGLA